MDNRENSEERRVGKEEKIDSRKMDPGSRGRVRNMEVDESGHTVTSNMDQRRITRSMVPGRSGDNQQVPDYKIHANNMSFNASRPGSVIIKDDYRRNNFCNSSKIMSVKSSINSHVSKGHADSVTSRLSALEKSIAIREKIAGKTLENELMIIEAEALERKAALMKRHSMEEIARNKEIEASAINVIQQIEEDVDEDQESRHEEFIDKAHDHELKDKLLCNYLNDCHIARQAEPDRTKREKTPWANIEYDKPLPRKVIAKTELPKVELPKFDGNPASYWNFVRQFEIYVEDRTDDPQQRLLFLMNYCVGKAKSFIDGYAILPAEEGYKKARATLQRKCGQPHVIAQKLLDDLFGLPKIQLYDEEALGNLATKMEVCHATLSQMDYLDDLDSKDTIHKIARKLPRELNDRWIRKTCELYDQGIEPKFVHLCRLIDHETTVAESRYAEHPKTGESSKTGTGLGTPRYEARWRANEYPLNSRSNDRRKEIHYVQGDAVKSCIVCHESHATSQCRQYIALPVDQRWERIKTLGGCFSCLKIGHAVKSCMARKTCGVGGCSKQHHPSLHKEAKAEEIASKTVMSSMRGNDSYVSLGFMSVLIKGPKGETEVCALLDTGSNTTLIKKEIINKLGITGKRNDINVNTVIGNSVLAATECELTARAMDRSDEVHMTGVYALEQLPLRLRARVKEEDTQRWSHLASIPRANLDGRAVDMIIGCDQTKAHWIQDVRLGKEGQPFGLKTPLGWVILGPVHREAVRSVYCTDVQPCGSKIEIEELIKQLYNQDFEDLGENETQLSAEEREAVKILTDGTLHESGHYVVPLPWKGAPEELGNNRSYAVKRLDSLRKRFLAQPELAKRYNEIIVNHLVKGYITKLDAEEINDRNSWYIPHHPVLNPHKPGKLRIVFDCAARFGSKSLNDFLHQGPDTINSLVGVLLRFRKSPVVIVADIEEMFLQVRLPTKDQNWMKFLWWKDGIVGSRIEALKMLVHPFGARSSPFCANFALKRSIIDNSEGMSELTKIIALNNIYVDDCIASVESVTEAKQVMEELTLATSKGGFKLRKWLSNNREVLATVPQEDLASSVQLLTNKELPTERALGVEWDAELDRLKFAFTDNQKPNSRRGVLSTMAAVFDPLGLIAPVVMKAKMLLQGLCKLKMDWDQELVGQTLAEWLEWKSQMAGIDRLEFPRCIKVAGASRSKQLHLFADASENGYGAVAYVRLQVGNEHVCRLLMAKARVAPLKIVSIPRLELSAAVLAVRMSKTIHRELANEFDDTFFWVDSTIVLHYIRNTSSRFATFVANRIQEILESTRVAQWRHVKSEHNPADYVSRGLTLLDDKLRVWIEGPRFLRQENDEWSDEIPGLEDPKQLETKRVVLHIGAHEDSAIDRLLRRYSLWTKLVRSVAWIIRFKEYYLTMRGKRDTVRVGTLNVDELSRAERSIIRYVQIHAFPEEYNALITDSPGFDWRTNRLRKLSPKLKEELMVVGGRLQLASVSSEQKHPIILPKGHAVTESIVWHVHRLNGHAGVNQTLVALRNNYWVLNGGATVKAILRKCLICRRLNATSAKQRMASLPESRVMEGWYPFKYVGLDYFGPFMVRRGRLLERRYGCIFTCLQCRAIHLELAQTLSTDSFILALMRFINRRGVPAEIASDNGGNFIGAERELGDWLRSLSQVKITDQLADKKIVWKFNPPSASHRGGIWERMIRSVRKILNSVARRQSFDEELLWTYLTHAERIINDRPLMTIRDGIEEPTPIRPSDLIQPKSNSFVAFNLPLSQLVERRWRLVNGLTAEFWKRWKTDYLNSLQERQKWFKKERELRVGDIVIIEAESTPRTLWPLGIIKETTPDSDGLVRTVTVKTSSGECKRDIRKVYLLEGTE